MCGFCTIQLNLHAYLRYRVCGCRLIKLLFMHVVVLADRRGGRVSIQFQLQPEEDVEEFPSFCLLYTVVEAKVSPMAVLTLSASIEWVSRQSSAEQHWPCRRMDWAAIRRAPPHRIPYQASRLPDIGPGIRIHASEPACPNCATTAVEGPVWLGPEAREASEGCSETTRALRCHVGWIGYHDAVGCTVV